MEVRERIIIESGALFGKYGIRSMTMDTLAEEMGISQPSMSSLLRRGERQLLTSTLGTQARRHA